MPKKKPFVQQHGQPLGRIIPLITAQIAEQNPQFIVNALQEAINDGHVDIAQGITAQIAEQNPILIANILQQAANVGYIGAIQAICPTLHDHPNEVGILGAVLNTASSNNNISLCNMLLSLSTNLHASTFTHAAAVLGHPYNDASQSFSHLVVMSDHEYNTFVQGGVDVILSVDSDSSQNLPYLIVMSEQECGTFLQSEPSHSDNTIIIERDAEDRERVTEQQGVNSDIECTLGLDDECFTEIYSSLDGIVGSDGSLIGIFGSDASLDILLNETQDIPSNTFSVSQISHEVLAQNSTTASSPVNLLDEPSEQDMLAQIALCHEYDDYSGSAIASLSVLSSYSS